MPLYSNHGTTCKIAKFNCVHLFLINLTLAISLQDLSVQESVQNLLFISKNLDLITLFKIT